MTKAMRQGSGPLRTPVGALGKEDTGKRGPEAGHPLPRGNGPARLGEEESTAAPRWDGPSKWHGKSSKPGLLAAPHSTS